MNVAKAYADNGVSDLIAQLAGGTLTVYTVARPTSADLPIDRSEALACFTFSDPAFGEEANGQHPPRLVEARVLASSAGTPGFVRARATDGSTVADFSAGPGHREIKFNEVSFSTGTPVSITHFQFLPENNWPERIDYYEAHPRTGYAMPHTL